MTTKSTQAQTTMNKTYI